MSRPVETFEVLASGVSEKDGYIFLDLGLRSESVPESGRIVLKLGWAQQRQFRDHFCKLVKEKPFG